MKFNFRVYNFFNVICNSKKIIYAYNTNLVELHILEDQVYCKR